MAPQLDTATSPVALPATLGAYEPETGELPVIANPVRWHPITWRQVGLIWWRWFGQFFVVGMGVVAVCLVASFVVFVVTGR